jgi:hypothetical protein
MMCKLMSYNKINRVCAGRAEGRYELWRMLRWKPYGKMDCRKMLVESEQAIWHKA